MTIPPDSIEVGRCYLVGIEWGERVRLVVRLLPDERVQFEDRRAGGRVFIWSSGSASLRAFAKATLREVPCDWTPAANETDP